MAKIHKADTRTDISEPEANREDVCIPLYLTTRSEFVFRLVWTFFFQKMKFGGFCMAISHRRRDQLDELIQFSDILFAKRWERVDLLHNV